VCHPTRATQPNLANGGPISLHGGQMKKSAGGDMVSLQHVHTYPDWTHEGGADRRRAGRTRDSGAGTDGWGMEIYSCKCPGGKNPLLRRVSLPAAFCLLDREIPCPICLCNVSGGHFGSVTSPRGVSGWLGTPHRWWYGLAGQGMMGECKVRRLRFVCFEFGRG